MEPGGFPREGINTRRFAKCQTQCRPQPGEWIGGKAPLAQVVRFQQVTEV